MNERVEGPAINLGRYEQLMDVVRNRLTSRQFNPKIAVPREHIEMVLEAARHAPSGANAQPWHYIVVTDPEVKRKIADYFVEEQRRRAKMKMKFPTPNYRGLETAPGFIVVVADFRFMRAFPVLLDGSDLDKQYQQNAERILLQSVAASTMSAHLAAAALGYQVWWVTAIGQEAAQTALEAPARHPGRSRCDRHHAVRHAGQAALQALEEDAAADHELGSVQHGELHDHSSRSISGCARSGTRSCIGTRARSISRFQVLGIRGQSRAPLKPGP